MTLCIALALNAAMFIIGLGAGLWAQSNSLVADAFDMLSDASACGLALMAASRSTVFKRHAARWSGALLLISGIGIILDAIRRALYGSEPSGMMMMVFSLASLTVNVSVLSMLRKFRHSEVHLRTIWIFTHMDVIANIAVFLSGFLVWLTGLYALDLLTGCAIGWYVIREAITILRETT